MAWCSAVAQLGVATLGLAPSGNGERVRSRWAVHFRRGIVGCLVSALVVGVGLSCIVQDPDYCETRDQCLPVDTPLGRMQPFCHPTLHTCLLTGNNDVCAKDDDCTKVDLPHCNVNTNICTACTVDDPNDHSCARFRDRPLCGAASDGSGKTLCLACRNNLDCPFDAPVCDSQQCRKCTAHSDCEGELKCDDDVKCTDSLVCIGAGELPEDHAGSCAQNGITGTGRVIYVNSLDPVCTPPAPPLTTLPWPAGSQVTTPQCTLPGALDTASLHGRRYIRVFGQGIMPPGEIKDGAAYSIIGAPRKGATALANVSSRGAAFTLSGTGTLTIDQLDILENNPTATVISCSGNITGLVPRLTVRRSVIRGSAPVSDPLSKLAAIEIVNCTTVLDGNVIGVSTLGATTDPAATAHPKGIHISDVRSDGGSSYLIQNNIIAGNMGVGLDLQGTSSATPNFVVRFNTIVGNGRKLPNSSGAVICAIGAVGQEFSHSIVWKNSLSVGEKSQLASAGDCGAQDLVVGLLGTDEGLTTKNPAFVYEQPMLDANLRLTKNSDCCVDKVTPGGNETLPTQDIDGTPRPQGTMWDIGASEVKK